MRAYHVTDGGEVICNCGNCDLDFIVAQERPPLTFEPEPEENEDLPF
jgi:hypothetical protein